MGCDIHPVVEVRRKGIWRHHRPTEPCHWYYEVYDQAEVTRLTNNGYTTKYGPVNVGDRRHTWDKCKTRLPDFFTNRKYAMFAILADVRNDGAVEHPIAPDRGLPADMDPRTPKPNGDHSDTWVGLDELQNYDLTTPLNITGIISERQYLETFLKRKDPTAWSGGIYASDIVVVTPKQWLDMWPDDGGFGPTSKGTRDPEKRYFITYEWMVPQVHHVPELPQWITYLEKVIPKGGTAADVRVVMNFDS